MIAIFSNETEQTSNKLKERSKKIRSNVRKSFEIEMNEILIVLCVCKKKPSGYKESFKLTQNLNMQKSKTV